MSFELKIDDKNVLRYFLFHDDFRRKVMEELSSDLFADEHCRDIHKAMVNYYGEFQKWPIDNLHVLITDNPWKQSSETISEKLEIAEPKNSEDYKGTDLAILLKRAEKWFVEAKRRNLLVEAVTNHQAEKNEGWIDWKNRFERVENFSFAEKKWVDVDDIEQMLEIHSKDVPKLATSWPEFNEFLKGGFKKKSINVFQGGTHSGKSRFLLSLSTSIRRADPKNDVLYITLEIQDEDFGIYSDMHTLEMNQEDIRSAVLKEGGYQWYRNQKAKTKEIYGKLLVQEFCANKCTPSTVKNCLETHLSHGHNIVAVMVDYIGIMSSDLFSSNMYEKGIQNVIGLRSISQEFEIPFFTAVQPNREGNRKNQKTGSGADMMDSAESKGIPDSSDFYGNIIQTETMYHQGVQLMNVLKNRHSGRVNERMLMEVTKDLYKVDIIGKEILQQEGEEEDAVPVPPMPVMGL